MEVLLALVLLCLAISFLLYHATRLVEQLKSGSVKLRQGFEARLSVVPVKEKSEVDLQKSNSASNDSDG